MNMLQATGDEVYLKRHLKLETDEKRRKRWDRQWMLEQKKYDLFTRTIKQSLGQQ